jgi:hypothetical protein
VGKYDAVIANLPRLPTALKEGGNNRQFEVDQKKAEFPDRAPSALLTAYAALRAEADTMDEKRKELGLRIEAVADLIIEIYEGEGITSLRVAGIGTVRTQFDPYARVSDPSTFRQWCLDNGFGDQMQLPWMTMNSVAKERLLANEEPPPGVEVYVKPKPVLTREK